MQQPGGKVPAAATESGSSEGTSIGAEVRKQLDLVGEQLARKVCFITAFRVHFVAVNMLSCHSGQFALCGCHVSMLTACLAMTCSV